MTTQFRATLIVKMKKTNQVLGRFDITFNGDEQKFYQSNRDKYAQKVSVKPSSLIKFEFAYKESF